MNVKEIVAKMTLEEKAGLCSGLDFWHTKPVEHLGVPSIMVSDGPHGLRKQDLDADNLGVNVSIKAVCFPSSCALACSFDKDLMYKLGSALGNECQAENVSVLLGPGTNIKRSPLCGRNFEYFSEDPYLASNIASNYIKGVQSQNVGTSLKHFLANNQEHRRMTVSAEIDERTLNEIYLASFETAVKEAKPWTVMCSYNRINGEFASENKTYLTDTLRNKWNFDGFVVSDWGAVNERVKGLEAGLDLEMPSSNGINDAEIVKAVKNGELDEKIVDKAVERILEIVYRYTENKKNAVWDKEADHKLSAEIEKECMVLLKNDDNVLPLDRNKKIAFIGKFAKEPRYQGGGSSHINSFKVTDALSASAKYADITYAQGYTTDSEKTYDVSEYVISVNPFAENNELKLSDNDEALISEAVETAKNSDVAVIFAGLPDSFESEGFDRTHMKMPDCQNELIRRVAEAQPNTVVVLHNGSPVEMPWVDDVKGILEAYLGGQAVGEAVSDILFGEANPSGKLAETFPKKLSDNPSYLNFPGESDTVEYKEGIFVGYRYYDFKEIDVLFPFGYGLSYTDFEYSNLKVNVNGCNAEVSVTVKNIGNMKGKEIVQLYVRDCESSVIRPLKELKGFEKVELEPDESKEVTFKLDRRSFSFYSTKIHDWFMESGQFEIMIGKSSRNIVLSETITIESNEKLPFECNMNTTFGDLLNISCAKKYTDKFANVFGQAMQGNDEGNEMGESTQKMLEAQLSYNPLRAMISFSDGKITHADVQEAIDYINENY